MQRSWVSQRSDRRVSARDRGVRARRWATLGAVLVVLALGFGRVDARAAPPRARVAGVAPRTIVVAVAARPRGAAVVFGIRRYRQGRLVQRRARRSGRATVSSLRPGTLYVVRARWARHGARWGRKVFVRTLRERPRGRLPRRVRRSG